MIKELFNDVNPIPVKKAMELEGMCSGIIKEPFSIYVNDGWINRALCTWYKKDTITCVIE